MALPLKKHNTIAELLFSNNLEINTEEHLELCSYFKMLYLNVESSEFLSIFRKKTKERWGINLRNWTSVINLTNQEDTYISVNSFYTPNNCISSKTVRLNSIILDLDYYNMPNLKGLTAEQIIGLMRMDIDYPEPSFYVDSGNGLYMFWLLNSTYSTSKSRSFYKKIEETLIDKFKNFGADNKVKDPARVLRIPGTINGKTGRKVRIILPNKLENLVDYSENPNRFELYEIASYFWGDKSLLEKKENKSNIKNKKRTKSKKVVSLKNLLTLSYSRAEDLKTLVKLREDLTGNREELLFLYRLHLLNSNIEPSRALDLTLELNSLMKYPLSENEVINATESAEKNAEIVNRLKEKYNESYGSMNKFLSENGAYIYKNETIINILNITESEQLHFETLIGATEKKRRKDIRNKDYYINNKKYYEEYYKEYSKEYYKNKLISKGKKSKKEEIEEIRQKIKALKEKGFKNKDISKELSLPTKTLERHITYLKKSGLL